MKQRQWMPHATVASVVHRLNANNEHEFLLVEEIINGNHVFNQPAGHLEENETLPQAALRETVEETAWQVELNHLIGIYLSKHPDTNAPTFIRHCFAATPQQFLEQPLDDGIIATHWLTRTQIAALPEQRLRSRMVLQCVDDFLANKHYPLELLWHDLPTAAIHNEA